MPVDVTENYIRIRIRDPDDFVKDSFRTIWISKDKGIKAIIGKLKSDPDGSTVVQAYLFDKDKWSVEEARAWIEEHRKEKSMHEIIKINEEKRIVYGCFLVPNKEDLQGDIISEEDVEKVAHLFLVEYRELDEMHQKQKAEAEIVESFITPSEMDYYGKVFPKGSWLGAVHISDDDIWEKIKQGEYKGFSVKIFGTRIK